jgi:hypothetical protein
MNKRAVAFLCLVSVASVAMADPPKVLVEFRIESQSFKDGLKADAAPVETALATQLATLLQTKFPPMQWVTGPLADPAATLTASLAEDDSAMRRIFIKWTAKIGTQPLTLHKLEEWTIYDTKRASRPYFDAAKTKTEVGDKIVQWMRVDHTRDDVHDDFLVQVPLSRQVELDTVKKNVVLPLSWRSAKLGEGSEFRVDFGNDPAPDMKIFLNNVGEARGFNGLTRSRVFLCTDSGENLPEGKWWKNCAEILTGNGAPPYVLRFKHYVIGEPVDGIAGTVAVQP